MERLPSMNLDSLTLIDPLLEPEPKTLSKEQLELTRAAVMLQYQNKQLPGTKSNLEEKPEKSNKQESEAADVRREKGTDHDYKDPQPK